MFADRMSIIRTGCKILGPREAHVVWRLQKYNRQRLTEEGGGSPCVFFRNAIDGKFLRIVQQIRTPTVALILNVQRILRCQEKSRK